MDIAQVYKKKLKEKRKIGRSAAEKEIGFGSKGRF